MHNDQAAQFMLDVLRMVVMRKGSDLFLTCDFPPAIKVDGEVLRISTHPLSGQQILALGRAIMNDKQVAEFERTRECNFVISRAGIGRFRVNAFQQQGQPGLVLRLIPDEAPTIDALGLPAVLKDVALTRRGLVILAGPTGSGKSSTQAAMVNHRNEQTSHHILTIEDPVEFVHQHKRSIITQREIGVDTEDWHIALKNALRQAPDVVLMGEIRDREAMQHALTFSQTGHLCMATLHANNAYQTLDRIINFFPEDRRPQLLLDLSQNLCAVVSQRLVPIDIYPENGTSNRPGRVAAVEVMLRSPLIADLIRKGQTPEIREVIKNSRDRGMQSFDQALYDLYEGYQISYQDSLAYADSENDLRLRIMLSSDRYRRSRRPGEWLAQQPGFDETRPGVLPTGLTGAPTPAPGKPPGSSGSSGPSGTPPRG